MEQRLQEILTEHAIELVKKVNLRVIVLIDPSHNNPYDGPLAVFAPGMMHITTEKLTELMAEIESDTEKFLRGIILKSENKIPRTIYISTETRRIFLRLIRIPNKKLDMIHPMDRDKAQKEFRYYLGISVIKNPSHLGNESPEEKPQAIFDGMDRIVRDLEKFL